MSSYYSRIMNIAAGSHNIEYRKGHRDARHAAANIATEAEREIAHLRAQIERNDELIRQATWSINQVEEAHAIRILEKALQNKENNNA